MMLSILAIIFISMLLAWNVVEQPEWCKMFWEWVSNIWNTQKTEEHKEELKQEKESA